MTPEEIQALAAKIAERLRRDWVPAPVRPDPPGDPSPGKLPPWAAAAQSLDDVAPSRTGTSIPRHRPAYDAVVRATRAAAAGQGSVSAAVVRGRGAAAGSSDAERVERQMRARIVPAAASNRHIHLSGADVERLFGAGSQLTVDRSIRQPGQFAARERVRVVGPAGSIDGVRVVGPPRAVTQVELALSDCRHLGVEAPIRASGSTTGSAPIRLEGPAGSVDLREGAIVAARHLHLSPEDAHRFGLADGDRVTIVLGTGDRAGTLPDVLVRAGPNHATELHVDVDEARAFNLGQDATAKIAGRPHGRAPDRAARPTRTLVTERDVAQIALDGKTLCDGGKFVVTPAARDRAKALGIWRDRS